MPKCSLNVLNFRGSDLSISIFSGKHKDRLKTVDQYVFYYQIITGHCFTSCCLNLSFEVVKMF